MKRSLLVCAGIGIALALGTVAAQRGPVSFQLTWVNRQGAPTPLGLLPPGTFAPRISPDGRRVAFDTGDGSIWIAELSSLASPRALSHVVARRHASGVRRRQRVPAVLASRRRER